jgi:hypothetical protein
LSGGLKSVWTYETLKSAGAAPPGVIGKPYV